MYFTILASLMKRAKTYKKNIFCLEGDWQRDLRDKSSIYAALVFLHSNVDVKYIYKQCGTRQNLQYYISEWKQKKYDAYSIGYLAFHGEAGSIQVGNKFISLDELGNMMEDSCQGRIIHFGSCKTLDTDDQTIIRFLEKTKAICVCGYQKDIDFVESSVFDMLLIEMFQKYKNIANVQKDVDHYYKALAKKLEFKLVHL